MLSFDSTDQHIPEEIRFWGMKHLKQDNVYRVIGEQLFSFIPVDELASMYSNTGRPSINPVVLSLVNIFQFLEATPDRVAVSGTMGIHRSHSKMRCV
jgi:hypothetical protein